MDGGMTYKKAIQVLKQYNAWLKGSDATMTNPAELTMAINVIVDGAKNNTGIFTDAQVNGLLARIKELEETVKALRASIKP